MRVVKLKLSGIGSRGRRSTGQVGATAVAGVLVAIGLVIPAIRSQSVQVDDTAALTAVSSLSDLPELFGPHDPDTGRRVAAVGGQVYGEGDLSQAPDVGTVSTVDTPANVLSSGFIRPVNGPVTSLFGPRFHPVLLVWKVHTGLDLGAACGTPVHAVKDGTVSFAGWGGGNGNRVVIDHGAGLSTSYNHLSAYAAAPGLAVKQGQVIGYVGSTGFSTGCHLHFEVMIGGVFTDPNPYLDLAPAPTVTIPPAVTARSDATAATTATAATPTPTLAVEPIPTETAATPIAEATTVTSEPTTVTSLTTTAAPTTAAPTTAAPTTAPSSTSSSPSTSAAPSSTTISTAAARASSATATTLAAASASSAG